MLARCGRLFAISFAVTWSIEGRAKGRLFIGCHSLFNGIEEERGSDSERIAQLTREAVSKSRPIVVPEMPGLPQFVFHGRRTEPGAKAALVSALSGEGELNIFDQQALMILAPDGSAAGSGVSFEMLADWLISRGSQVGADQAVDELRRYVANQDFACMNVLAIAGLQTNIQLDVGDGIKLVPFSEVPESLWKAGLENIPSLLPLQNLAIAHSALTQEYRAPKYHTPIDGDRIERSNRPSLPDLPDLLDACLLMTLVGPGAPVAIARWTVPDSAVPCTLIGGSGAQRLLEGTVGPMTSIEADEDVQRIQRLYEAYRRLSDNERNALRVPLGRLNSAARRSGPVDAAIDLGIALEALFLSDLDERTELTFRLRLRASRLLEQDVRRRQELSSFLTKFYKARSLAVHSGRLPDKVSSMKVSIIIERAAEVVRRSLEHMIFKGKPDWEEVQFGQ